jgi:hypothetical protein
MVRDRKAAAWAYFLFDGSPTPSTLFSLLSILVSQSIEVSTCVMELEVTLLAEADAYGNFRIEARNRSAVAHQA